MPRFACISFLTDYGTADGFVACCHGVLARLAPAVRVIDVTHLVPSWDVRRGAAVLAQTLPWLPPGVHLAVVDPGVGTPRAAVVVTAGDHLLVGPDNGLLVPAARALGGPGVAYELDPALVAGPDAAVSATFHGRDLFAPAAARLAAGSVQPGDLGPRMRRPLVTWPEPMVEIGADGARAAVVTVDGFGNVQTALSPAAVPELTHGEVVVRAGGAQHRAAVVDTFAAVAPGALALFTDSAGFLALGCNRDSAAQRLGVRAEDIIELRRAPAAE